MGLMEVGRVRGWLMVGIVGASLFAPYPPLVTFIVLFFLLFIATCLWFSLAQGRPVEVDVKAHPLLSLSAVKLAAMIKRGEVTSSQLVEEFIAQIERVNPDLNAVVTRRYDEAREEARHADELTRNTSDKNRLPPLHGVPCSVKEVIGLKGKPQTSGLWLRRNTLAEEDATVVKRLREAGAIPICMTNISELCMWMESDNLLYGLTRNPYNTAHTVGGSSGGEGCIVGAAGAPFGVGSDIGGSIRLPSFFNGIFGHKPSSGLVPNTGQYPIAKNEALNYLTTGPMSKRAEDLMPLLRIMAGPDGNDDYCKKMTLGDPEDVDIRNVRVLWADVPYNMSQSVSPEMLKAQARCVEHLKSLGAKEVTKIDLRQFGHATSIWSSMLEAAGGPTFSELMGNGKPVHASVELLRWFFNYKNKHTLPAIGLGLLEAVPRLFPQQSQKFIAMGKKLREEVQEILGSDGILIMPTYTSPAPKHHLALIPPTNWVSTAIWNVMEVPVTAVPMGLSREGLPLGVQVIARHGDDHRTIAIAMMLEREFGGWVPPGRHAVRRT